MVTHKRKEEKKNIEMRKELKKGALECEIRAPFLFFFFPQTYNILCVCVCVSAAAKEKRTRETQGDK